MAKFRSEDGAPVLSLLFDRSDFLLFFRFVPGRASEDGSDWEGIEVNGFEARPEVGERAPSAFLEGERRGDLLALLGLSPLDDRLKGLFFPMSPFISNPFSATASSPILGFFLRGDSVGKY